MKSYAARLLLLGMMGVLTTASLSAQKIEISPYFGGVWPTNSNVGEIRTNALWGVRADFHVDPSFAFEANFGYLNHFSVEGVGVKSRGIIWEGGPTYFFDPQDWPVPKAFTPYLSATLGGVTTKLSNIDNYSYNLFENVQFINPPGTQTIVRTIRVEDRDTFFTISAGGGVKVNPGPFGLRFDVRGRMLPNYYRASPIWLEASVGLNFVF